jgi:radical SAM protein with 4Fe4S-binding SPASM domain
MQVLAQEGARHMVRSMITPDNVCLMEKMLEELHKKFPFVKNVLFDPITSSTTFSDKEITRKFYNLYIKHFLSVRSLGKKLGIDVGNASLRNLDLIVDRYCAGEFCLTPDGAITICHQVSSPREKGYEDFIYGRVIDGRLTIDREKFLFLKSRYTVYDNPRCNDCDVKWTCGGGCTQQRRQYSDDILDIVCEAERRLTTAFLLERIANGANINEMIETYGR